MREVGILLFAAFFLAKDCGCAGSPPPQEPPDSLLSAFTLNHTVPLELYYVDDSNGGKGINILGSRQKLLTIHSQRHGTGTHYKYSQSDVDQLIVQAKAFIQQALSVAAPNPPATISPSTWRTQTADIWLVQALQQHSVAGHRAVGACDTYYSTFCSGAGGVWLHPSMVRGSSAGSGGLSCHHC